MDFKIGRLLLKKAERMSDTKVDVLLLDKNRQDSAQKSKN